jgi:hypothetical protein
MGTPAGTYSSAAPFEMHWPSSSQSRPTVLRTVPSNRSVNEEPSTHRCMLEAVVNDPVRGSYSAAAVHCAAGPGPGFGLIGICHQHGAIRQQCRGVVKPGRLSECGPGSRGRVVHLSVHPCLGSLWEKGSDRQHLAIGLQEGPRERRLRVHVRDRGPGPRDGVVYLGRVQHVVVHPPESPCRRNEDLPIGQEGGRCLIADIASRRPAPRADDDPGRAGQLERQRRGTNNARRSCPEPLTTSPCPCCAGVAAHPGHA